MRIPSVELLAGLRQSRDTADHEGFPQVAEQVQRYIDQIEQLGPGTLVVKNEDTKLTFVAQIKNAIPDITIAEINWALEAMHLTGTVGAYDVGLAAKVITYLINEKQGRV